MNAMLAGARLLDAGETALVIEFGDRVDMGLHDRVMALDAAIRHHGIAGVRETVPTYRSLMIHYDPLQLSRDTLLEQVTGLGPVAWRQDSQRWVLPVCFDPELADDLRQTADLLNLSPQAVEDGLLRSTFRLYMYGFAPGFAYLGGLVPELALPRRATPRPLMPASSIIIAGGLAAIGAVAMPTGWYVVASTPVSMFEPERVGHVPFGVGDEIRFERVDREAYEALKVRADAGEMIWHHASASSS